MATPGQSYSVRAGNLIAGQNPALSETTAEPAAITTTPIPILQKSGFWAMAQEARVDYAILLGCIFLLRPGLEVRSKSAGR